jgi:hypothetical protein
MDRRITKQIVKKECFEGNSYSQIETLKRPKFGFERARGKIKG